MPFVALENRARVHGLVKSFQGDGPKIPAVDFIKIATDQAEEGLRLVKKVKNWVIAIP